MGNLFRSKEMSLVQLFIQTEVAYATMAELGELGVIQFRDLNPDLNAFQRRYVNQVRRCEDMERILRFLNDQIVKSKMKVKPLKTEGRALRHDQAAIDDLYQRLRELDEDVHRLDANEESLKRNHKELIDMRYVLDEAETILSGLDPESRPSIDDHTGGQVDYTELLPAFGGSIELDNIKSTEEDSSLGIIAGVVDRRRVASFERILWRTMRGNLYVRFADIEEPIPTTKTKDADGNEEEVQLRCAFVVLVKGPHATSKARKICETFGASTFPCPDNSQGRRELLLQASQRVEDLNSVLNRTAEHRRRVVGQIAEQFEEWSTIVRKEKAIYFTLNKFNVDVTSKCLIAEGWACTEALSQIRETMAAVTERTQTVIPSILNVISTKETPPTHFETNKFTEAFQAIIESYGVARYQEVNPTPFAIITFPFLFAVMFGDFGHGIMMSIIAAFVVYYEKSLVKLKDDEMFGMIYSGRYIILLMGLFSIFTGLMYNDMFSKVLPIFESGWDFTFDAQGNAHGTFKDMIYPFGLDYAWHGTENMLIFHNSYKMKMSIIFGVLQMSFGIVLSLYNHIHFKKSESIWFEFVPQVLFLESIFGYLVICIIYKWTTYWPDLDAPSLLNMLINMFLSPGKITGVKLYSGQETVQIILLAICLVSIPWMLLFKPFILRAKHNRKVALAAATADYHTVRATDHDHSDIEQSDANQSDAQGHVAQPLTAAAHGEEEFEFAEVFIHQVIHTIEFCLGAISNTASYLRLWALSLAHAQLAEVLWTMVIGTVQNIGAATFIGMWAGSAAWLALTLAILVFMEGLSAFLHALRLHWVEFNNKFYLGDGYRFRPFNFKVTDDDQEDSA